MAKRLIVCCDGTWNTADQAKGGQPCPTNVTKLALAIASSGTDGIEQRVFYEQGVGTSRWERLRGGAFGFGLSRNVLEAYRFLVQNYEPGDELFFFGFSRGAFTARSTAGLVRNAGVLRPEHEGLVDEAYDLYRSRTDEAHPRGVEATLFRRSHAHEPGIRFIGVWDTVGSLGIPMSGMRWANAFNRRWQFHDTQLSSRVEGAFHAVAIDEQRQPFKPTLWEADPEAVGQRVEQVWFSGVHCDVGGGYPESGLSDLTLLWMMERARDFGLGFRDGVPSAEAAGGSDEPELTLRPDPLGKAHQSRSALYRLQRPNHRSIGKTDPPNEYVASSAVHRHEKHAAYTPPGLVRYVGGSPQVMAVPIMPREAH